MQQWRSKSALVNQTLDGWRTGVDWPSGVPGRFRGERHASARPTVLSCKHSGEVMIGPVACLSKEYLAQWPYERLQRPRSPTHACSRPPLVQSLLMMRSRWWEREREKKKKTPAHEKQKWRRKGKNCGSAEKLREKKSSRSWLNK